MPTVQDYHRAAGPWNKPLIDWLPDVHGPLAAGASYFALLPRPDLPTSCTGAGGTSERDNKAPFTDELAGIPQETTPLTPEENATIVETLRCQFWGDIGCSFPCNMSIMAKTS